MGFYVFTLIAFPANAKKHPTLQQIAGEHWHRLRNVEGREQISVNMLVALHRGECLQGCTKGEAVAYAAVGNYTRLEQLRDDLLPFFADLYKHEVLLSFERIVMMINSEQHDSTNVMEISWPDGEDYKTPPQRTADFSLNVREFPNQAFHWGQS